MSADGVWKVEQMSIGGWEPAGIAFMEDGRYLRGGVDAFTVGQYEVDGSRITVKGTTTRLGAGRPVYGTDTGKVEITLTGELTEGQITGEATDGSFVAHYRFTRLADLP